jgi:hypothetical protein
LHQTVWKYKKYRYVPVSRRILIWWRAGEKGENSQLSTGYGIRVWRKEG